MNRTPAVLHRVSVGLLALALLALGAGAILWKLDVEPVHTWVERIDEGWLARAAQAGWWPALLAGVLIVALVWGWALLATAVRPGKVDDIVLAGSDERGTFTVAPALIASAVADQLAASPIVAKATAKATDDRGRKIIRLTVIAAPTRSYSEVADVVGDAVSDIRSAVGDSDLHVQALVHLENTAR